MNMQGLTRALCVLVGLASCGSLATGSIWISSISVTAFGNASWVDPVAGPQTGVITSPTTGPTGMSRSVDWPTSWALGDSDRSGSVDPGGDYAGVVRLSQGGWPGQQLGRCGGVRQHQCDVSVHRFLGRGS